MADKPSTTVVVGDSSNKNEIFALIGFLVVLCCLCYCSYSLCISSLTALNEMQRRQTSEEET